MSDSTPSGQLPPGPRLSGRVVVISFAIFIVVGVVGSILIARSMRPVTMEARERAMPLSGTVAATCVHAEGGSHNLREQGTCPAGGALTFSIPDAGRGLQQITFAVLSQNAEQQPIVGQFSPDGSGRAELKGLAPGPYMAAFLYTTEPLEAAKVEEALKGAPRTDIPKQEQALELVVSDQLRAKKEARLARIYFKVTP
jgi:hypothetical protein